MRFAGIALALAAAASAQVSVPLLGWLPQGTEIRPIHGLPGGAVLAPALNVGHRLANIAVSPSENYVLATDAQSGVPLLIQPGVSLTTLAAPAKPDRIVTSPRGSSAALYYSANGLLEIVSGLPASPSFRSIGVGAVSAIAVSDDGQSLAAASSAGVYEWGPDGAALQLYSGSDAGALAFFSNSANLAIATATQILSVTGAGPAVLYQGSLQPAGLGISFDNRKIVLADHDGTVYSIDAQTGAPSTLNCGCTPGGVFPMGGAVFRLTATDVGPVKLADAQHNAIFAIPRPGPAVRRLVAHPAQTPVNLPTLTINLSPMPGPTGFLEQPALTVTASSPAPVEIDGTVTLTFTSQYGQTDTSIQFSNASTTANFTIPAGSAQANFSGAPNITFSTGSIAGVIQLAANVTAPQTVSPAALETIVTTPTVPFISSVQLEQTPGGITIVVVGYSSSVDVSSGTFNFSITSNATLSTNDITVSVSPEFEVYFATSALATGSQFTLSVPFAISGNPTDITGVTVTMINSKGESSPVSSQ